MFDKLKGRPDSYGVPAEGTWLSTPYLENLYHAALKPSVTGARVWTG
jgi:hypothetical protein